MPLKKIVPKQFGTICSCEEKDRTSDLRVMSPTSYRCSTSRCKSKGLRLYCQTIKFNTQKKPENTSGSNLKYVSLCFFAFKKFAIKQLQCSLPCKLCGSFIIQGCQSIIVKCMIYFFIDKKLKIYIVSVSPLPPSFNLLSLLLQEIKVKNTTNMCIKFFYIFAKLPNLRPLFIPAKFM